MCNNRIVQSTLLALVFGCATAGAALTYTTTWFGNTFGSTWSGDWGTPIMHVPQRVDAMFVSPDGMVYTNCEWDEGGIDGGLFYKGDLVGRFDFGAGSWGRNGCDAVCANDTFAFAAMSQGGGIGNSGNPNGLANEPDNGSTWFCVTRYMKNGRLAKFATGLGYNGAMLVVNTNGGAVHGLAVDGRNKLFVSETYSNTIKIYNPLSMAAIGSWTITKPGALALDNDGSLWIMQLTQPRTIVHYSATGQQLAGAVTFAATVEPRGFCLDGNGKLLVTDAGRDHNIKIYNVNNLTGSPTTVASTFGEVGGLISGTPGLTGDRRFYQPTSIGCDNAGNVYLSWMASALGSWSACGVVIESYVLSSGARNVQWPKPLYGLLWLDRGDIDPGSESDIYTGDKHFTFDYRNATPGQGWTFKGFTVNRYKYPDDPRANDKGGCAGTFVRRIGGKPILFMFDQYTGPLRIFRFNAATDGEIAIPCGMISRELIKGTDWPPPLQPASGEWIWRDKNGNGAFDAGEYEQPTPVANAPQGWGWCIDKAGTIWQAAGNGTIRTFPIQGLDANGSPIYSFTAVESENAPAYITELMRIEYDVDNDAMYLGCYTQQHPHTGEEWGALGTEIVGFSNWSKTSRAEKFRTVLPYDWSNKLFCKEMCRAGDYVFAVECRAPDIHVFSSQTGTEVGMLTPGPEVGRMGGWVDMAYGISALKRANGEYAVIAEEDGYIKNLLYRWCPDGNCQETGIATPGDVRGSKQIRGAARTRAGDTVTLLRLDGTLVQNPKRSAHGVFIEVDGQKRTVTRRLVLGR